MFRDPTHEIEATHAYTTGETSPPALPDLGDGGGADGSPRAPNQAKVRSSSTTRSRMARPCDCGSSAIVGLRQDLETIHVGFTVVPSYWPGHRTHAAFCLTDEYATPAITALLHSADDPTFEVEHTRAVRRASARSTLAPA